MKIYYSSLFLGTITWLCELRSVSIEKKTLHAYVFAFYIEGLGNHKIYQIFKTGVQLDTTMYN